MRPRRAPSSRRCSSSACRSCSRRLRPTARGAALPEITRLDELSELPFTVKDDLRESYPLGMLAVPKHAAAAHPRLQRHRRHADRRRLHRARPRRLVEGDGALHGDGRRAARHGRPQRLRLRALHRRARLPPGRRADRRARDPGLGRRHRPPGDAAARPRRPGPVLHAVLRAAHRPGPARGRDRHGRARARDRHVRRRAVDRGHAHPARGRARPEGAQRLRAVARSSARASRPSARRRATACTCRRTTSSSRSSTPRPAATSRTAPTASSSSRR